MAPLPGSAPVNLGHEWTGRRSFCQLTKRARLSRESERFTSKGHNRAAAGWSARWRPASRERLIARVLAISAGTRQRSVNQKRKSFEVKLKWLRKQVSNSGPLDRKSTRL